MWLLTVYDTFMEKLKSFLSLGIFTDGNLHLNLGGLLLIIGVAFFFWWLLRLWQKKVATIANNMGHEDPKTVLSVTRWFFRILFLVVWLVVVMQTIGVDLATAREMAISFLNKELSPIERFHLTVSDILLIGLFFFGIRFLLFLIQTKLRKFIFMQKQVDKGRQQSLIQIFSYVLYTLFIIASMELVGIDVSLLLAGSAALLVGLGFGIQHIFHDLISGLIMLFEGNVEIGDIIDSGGLLGKVKKIGLRTSEVETRAGVSIIVPNAKFMTDNVVNWTHQWTNVRFEVKVGVAYGSDVQLVKQLLLDCAQKHEHIDANPKPFVRFADFGNSSLDFELFFWSKQVWAIEDIKSDLRFWIDEAFRAHKVEIPFPQRDLHIRSSDVPLYGR